MLSYAKKCNFGSVGVAVGCFKSFLFHSLVFFKSILEEGKTSKEAIKTKYVPNIEKDQKKLYGLFLIWGKAEI